MDTAPRCRFLLLTAACLAFVGPGRAADEPNGAKLGTKIANVTFKTADGQTTGLHDLKDKQAIVVVFLNFECPNSTGSASTLAELAKRHGDKVAFLGVCACEDDATTVAKQAREFKLGFPVYKDEKYAAVEAFKADTTPEVVVLDHNYVLRYRGRIDDGYSGRLKKNLVITSHDLEKALDELLAGKAVSTPVTKAVGCPIVADRDVKKDGKVTYYRDVLPILQNRCQSCHRAGEVGPFALTSYKQAVNWASDIKSYTQSRQMPPWKITEGVAFHNERTLTDKEIATLAAWTEDGTPAGDPKEAPKAKEFTDGWALGEPDLVVESKEEFVLGPGGRDLFRCFVLPTDVTEDKYVVAYEVKPGNPRIVHHTLNFLDTSGRGRGLEAKGQLAEKDKKEGDPDRGPGYSQSMGIGFTPSGAIGGWAPGQMPYQLPEGYGWKLPKGSDVVIQVHYHRDGRVEKDRTKIGLYFAKKPDNIKPFKGGVIAGVFLALPANDDHVKVVGTSRANEDCTVYSIMPHMHLIGRSIKVTMKPPDGEAKTLLAIADWDYNWQETYFFKEPLTVKEGTLFEVESIYDNSSKNPNNPNNPPKPVILGEQTTNEMCFVFFGATSAGNGRRGPISPVGFGSRREPPRTDPKPEEKKSEEKPADKK